MSLSVIIKKIVTTLASSEKGRKILGGILGVGIGVPIMAMAIVIMAVTGLFDFLCGAANSVSINQSWAAVRANISAELASVNKSINTEIKSEVYSFMPEFSVNISKAVLQQNFFSDGNNSFLLLYDSSEIEESLKKSKEIIDKLKAIETQYELSVMLENTKYANYTLEQLKADKAFQEDTKYDTSVYSEVVKDIIYILLKAEMPDYGYTYDNVEINGEKAKRQTLKVEKDGKTEIVEYICYGEGDIYLPRFLALYQGKTYKYMEEQAKKDGDGINSDIAEVINGISDKNTSKGYDVKIDENALSKLNLFQANELGQVFAEAIDDGSLGASLQFEETDTIKKITITLKTPSERDWLNAFDYNYETDKKIVDEYTRIIEKVLKDNGIKDLRLPLDTTMQQALFTYFQGFFNLPVESSDLKENSNGVLTLLNEQQKIHTNGNTPMSKSYEQGITLHLNSANTPIKVGLLPTGKCIEEIYVADVYDSSLHEPNISTSSYTYNYSAVTLDYLIDTEQFEKEYGFSFPTIVGSTGKTLEADGGYISLLVEYSCLDRLENITELDIGRSLYDIFDEDDRQMLIGYCHSGTTDSRKDTYTSPLTYYHSFESEVIPHVCIKTSFIDGTYVCGEYEQGHLYDGLSARFIGIKVNPLLWFKSYRTDIDSDAFKYLEPIIIK